MTVVNLVQTMNSRKRVDNNISFMFNASSISWHIIMRARIIISAFDQDEDGAKGKRKQQKRNLTRPGLGLELDSYNEQTHSSMRPPIKRFIEIKIPLIRGFHINIIIIIIIIIIMMMMMMMMMMMIHLYTGSPHHESDIQWG